MTDPYEIERPEPSRESTAIRTGVMPPQKPSHYYLPIPENFLSQQAPSIPGSIGARAVAAEEDAAPELHGDQLLRRTTYVLVSLAAFVFLSERLYSSLAPWRASRAAEAQAEEQDQRLNKDVPRGMVVVQPAPPVQPAAQKH